MENWILYAIVSLFAVGLFNFGMKVIVMRNYNTSFVTIISYTSASIASGIYYILNNEDIFLVEGLLLILLFALFHRFFLFLSTITRVEGLKNVDTTIFYPIYKALFPILMTIISVFYFGENLSFRELLGIIIGISIPLLLITKIEDKLQSNLKLGIVFILLTTFTAGIGSFLSKILVEKALNLDLFIFLGFTFGIFISYLNYKISKKRSNIIYSKKGVYSFGIILGFFTFLGLYTFTYSLSGNLAIAVTINSFSILIPIILSIIFYKEDITFKKVFVIILSIISVLFFL